MDFVSYFGRKYKQDIEMSVNETNFESYDRVIFYFNFFLQSVVKGTFVIKLKTNGQEKKKTSIANLFLFNERTPLPF